MRWLLSSAIAKRLWFDATFFFYGAALLLLEMPTVSCQVLPLEPLIRNGWNTNLYLKGSDSKPFLVEDRSKAHLGRIAQLTKSEADWAYIGVISLISREAELIGKWCEGCPCHGWDTAADFPFKTVGPETQELVVVDGFAMVSAESESCKKPARKPPRRPDQLEAASCSFKCCRAPELALGRASDLQESLMVAQAPLFNRIVARTPGDQRGIVDAAWTTARSRPYGCLCCACQYLLMLVGRGAAGVR